MFYKIKNQIHLFRKFKKKYIGHRQVHLIFSFLYLYSYLILICLPLIRTTREKAQKNSGQICKK